MSYGGGSELVPVDWNSIVNLLLCSSTFRSQLSDAIKTVPFKALFFETTHTGSGGFEFVCIDSKILAFSKPNPAPFANYILGDESKTDENIAVFPNLGRNAILIVPKPLGTKRPTTYTHLVQFLRNADDDQVMQHIFDLSTEDSR
jgi:hypothetical protein